MLPSCTFSLCAYSVSEIHTVILYRAYNTFYSLILLYSVASTKFSGFVTIYFSYCTVYAVYCSVHSTIYSILCTLYPVLSTLYPVLYTLYPVLTTVHPLLFTQSSLLACTLQDPGFTIAHNTTYWTDLFVRHFLFQADSAIDSDDLLFFVRKKQVPSPSHSSSRPLPLPLPPLPQTMYELFQNRAV